jgi:hypothetical protein
MVRLLRATHGTNGSHLFTVDFMDWDTFRNAMLKCDENRDTWRRMTNADCLIGGIDTSLSYLYVFFFFTLAKKKQKIH